MITGSCLCAGVRYVIDGTIDEVSICHCGQCRKASGGGGIAVCPLPGSRFRLLQGQDLLREFRATPGKARVFCGRCGSPLYSCRDDLPDTLRVRLGSLDSPVTCANRYHIHVDSRASWDTLPEGEPRYPGARPTA